MQIVTVVSDAYQKIYNEYYLPSLYKNINANEIDIINIKHKNNGHGIYADSGYVHTVQYKLSVIIDLIKANTNKLIMITDVDILWLKPFITHIENIMSFCDIAWSKSTDPNFKSTIMLNSGITVFRSNEKLLDFFSAVKNFGQNKSVLNDIAYANILSDSIDINYRFLDRRFSTCLLHVMDKIPEDTISYHATNMPNTNDLNNKYYQLNKVLNQFTVNNNDKNS